MITDFLDGEIDFLHELLGKASCGVSLIGTIMSINKIPGRGSIYLEYQDLV